MVDNHRRSPPSRPPPPPPPVPLFEAKFSSAPLAQEDLSLKNFSGATGGGTEGEGVQPPLNTPPPSILIHPSLHLPHFMQHLVDA